MSLTGSQKTQVAAGFVLLTGGLAGGVYSTLRSDIPLALLSTSLAFAGVAFIALVVFRRCVTDTRDERRELARARRAADDEKMRFVALEAALETEATRMHRDLTSERARIAATLAVERAALQAEFEERRLEEAQAAFQTGVEMERSGALRPDTPIPANIISFPRKAPSAEPEQERSHERSREHGGVRP